MKVREIRFECTDCNPMVCRIQSVEKCCIHNGFIDIGCPDDREEEANWKRLPDGPECEVPDE